MGKNAPKKESEKKEESDSEDDGDFEVEEGESGSGSSSSEESGSSSGDEEGSDEEESSEDEADDKPKGPDPLASHHDTIKSSGFTIHSATVGSNAPNEDRILIDPANGLFGVFDGHGGSVCSTFCAERFGGIFAGELEKQGKAGGGAKKQVEMQGLEEAFFGGGVTATGPTGGGGKAEAAEADRAKRKCEMPRVALKAAFARVDEEFLKEKGEDNMTSGACALVCYVGPGSVWAACAGDSRAVLVRKKRGVTAVPMSEDQNTSNKAECAKVVLRRVAGTLMVTRALGDGYLKRPELSQPPYNSHLPYITSKPKVQRVNTSPSETYLVVATDGVWEHMTSEEVAIEVDRIFSEAPENTEHPNPAMRLVDAVIRHAAEKQGLQGSELKRLPPGRYRRTYIDDITVVLVALHEGESVGEKRGRDGGKEGGGATKK